MSGSGKDGPAEQPIKLAMKERDGGEVPVARPSASVVLMRDGPDGLELYMVVRHHEIDFASGALVFPGGKLDPGDRDAGVRDYCDAAGQALETEMLAFRVGAIREAFEEAGVLFARAMGEERLVDQDRLATLSERYRQRLIDDDIAIGEVCARERLQLATDQLVPFAHWVTPETLPKRFDTRFYIAQAPENHLALHDGQELVDSIWIRAADVLDGAKEGRYTLVFATRMNLIKLARAASVEEAMASAASEKIVRVMPEVTIEGGVKKLKIPAEAGYGVSEVTVASSD